jgi:hypothetical protein
MKRTKKIGILFAFFFFAGICTAQTDTLVFHTDVECPPRYKTGPDGKQVPVATICHILKMVNGILEGRESTYFRIPADQSVERPREADTQFVPKNLGEIGLTLYPDRLELEALNQSGARLRITILHDRVLVGLGYAEPELVPDHLLGDVLYPVWLQFTML